MIKGMHGVFFTPQAEAARTFIQEKLEFPHVDAGHGFLIFDVPKAEFAIHPGDDTHHEIAFWCDDIKATTKELREKGVAFKSQSKTEVSDSSRPLSYRAVSKYSSTSPGILGHNLETPQG